MYDMTVFLMLAIFLLPSMYFDLKSRKIPNWLTLPAILTGLTYNVLLDGREGFIFSTVGLVFGIGLLILPYLMGGMGAGDVKLMGAIGSIVGPVMTVRIFLVSAVLGLAFSLIVIIADARYRDAIRARVSRLLQRKNTGTDPAEGNWAFPRITLPYGVVLAVGALFSSYLFP
jgi:prepilin peptidase CpaA